MSAARTMAACLDSVRAESRARPFSDETFEALRIRAADGIMGKAGEASLIGTFATLDAAIEAAQTRAERSETFAIKRKIEATGRVTLHFYAVRQKSAPVGWDSETGHAIYRRYSEHLHDLVLDATVLG